MKIVVYRQGDILFTDVIAEYEKIEPAGSDSWNPLGNERELWHRVRLFLALNWAIQQIAIPVEKIKILDVGCGVGRSTRALLEFGVQPENLLGIDIRSSAIEIAKSINPRIPFKVVNSLDDWPIFGNFDLCIQCTVFSSIREKEERLILAEMMEKTIKEQGYIFWWDRNFANQFAGADILLPAQLFRQSLVINSQTVCLKPSILESIKIRGRVSNKVISILQKMLGYQSTHTMVLFKKKI